jgi:hypothetical protein
MRISSIIRSSSPNADYRFMVLLPPAVARSFVDDMRAFFAEPTWSANSRELEVAACVRQAWY